MPLTLVLGPANAAKAGEVLSAYAAAAATREALLVVPTAADAVHYDRELSGSGVVLGRAVTFTGLLGEIALRTGIEAPPERMLTALQRARLLRQAIASLELPLLGAAAGAAGFAAAAGRLLTELQLARVGVPRFAGAMRAWAAGDRARAAYAGELAAVLAAGAAALERSGRLDPQAFAWVALDALRATPQRWGPTPVFVYGFDDLTRIERDAIETLSRLAGAAVTVSLTYEAAREALAARGEVVEALRAIADAVRELPASDDHYAPAARAALHHLERHLFDAPPVRLDPGDAVALLEAGGELAEAELVCGEVLDALRAGVPAAEIAVVCRSPARTGALLERVLARMGVASACDRRVPLAHTPLGRGLLALGRCALLGPGETSADDLLAYVRTPGVAGGPEQLDELDAAIARGGLRSAEAARAAAGRLSTPLETPELDALREAADPAAELAAAVHRLLAAPRRRAAARLDPVEALDAGAAAAALRALDELQAVGPVGGVELLELLAGVEVHAPAPGSGGVLIADPLAIRARRFRRVIVCGLCESEFPAVAGTPEPFLGEDRRRELALASGLALAVEPDPLARERYLFYACATRATERLVLSWRSADEDGRAVLASPFLADVEELFVPEWRERRRRRLLADVVWPEEGAPPSTVDRRPAAGPSNEVRTLGAAALTHVRHREVVSGGALEAFADCPVRWLVESQLQPQRLEPDAEPLVRGEFMHRVLERVVRELAELGGPVTEASLPQAERLLAEHTAAPPPGLAPGAPAAVRAALLRGIEADLRRYLRHEAASGCRWTPSQLELKFGMEEEVDEDGADRGKGDPGLPALELGEGDDRVRVRGVIDRVDVEPGGRRAIVRDYKSGASLPERAGRRWLDGGQFQVGVYMIAVRRLLGLEPVAGLYQPLRGRELRARGAVAEGVEIGCLGFSTDVFEAAALAALLDEVEAEAVRIAAALRQGALAPAPASCSRDGCRHPGICWAVR